MNSPSRSFGSNHVLFGGMTRSASDTAMSSSTVVGYNQKATDQLPLSTNPASCSGPRTPPTKSIRGSDRWSFILIVDPKPVPLTLKRPMLGLDHLESWLMGLVSVWLDATALLNTYQIQPVVGCLAVVLIAVQNEGF